MKFRLSLGKGQWQDELVGTMGVQQCGGAGQVGVNLRHRVIGDAFGGLTPFAKPNKHRGNWLRVELNRQNRARSAIPNFLTNVSSDSIFLESVCRTPRHTARDVSVQARHCGEASRIDRAMLTKSDSA